MRIYAQFDALNGGGKKRWRQREKGEDINERRKQIA